MRRMIILVAGLLALTSTSTQGIGGVFIIGGNAGSVHPIGVVVRGSRIVVDISAKQAG